ncbi:hypothetical protein [Anatilimnocola aggregata]|nr:hypothetical protein [Anatilimnocola aggregata]
MLTIAPGCEANRAGGPRTVANTYRNLLRHLPVDALVAAGMYTL